jgi:phage tail tape-measure protein
MRKSWIAIGLAAAIITFPGLSAGQQFSETEKGTGVGALIGAGTGAIVGAAVHHPIAGTFIGAGVGGVSGYAIGREMQQQNTINEENRRAIASEQRQINLQRQEILQMQQNQDTE